MPTVTGRCIARIAALVLSCGALHAQTCEQLPKGIAGWWPGDGNANDISLAANNGTLVNGTTFGTGVDGQGFVFDGVNDRMDVLDTPTMRPAKFTLAAWVRSNVTLPGACIICKQIGTGDANSYSLWASGGFLRGGMFRFAEAIAPITFDVNRTYHVATTYDGLLIRLYVDGVLVASGQGPATPVGYDTSQVIVGADDNGVNAVQGFWNGLIDEPMIFGRALSACEIRAMARSRGRGECKGDQDGDTFPDYQDNCRSIANAGQQDTDLDGTGDACDCAPSDPLVYAKPGNYLGLLFEARDTLDWCGEPIGTGPSTTYEVVRGDLDDLPVTGSTTSECRSHCETAPTGLLGWWPADGNGTALVGGNNGTLENGATVDTGFVRQAFRFDGVDDRVRTGSMSVTNTFSVAAWVNSDLVLQGGYRRIAESSYATGFFLGTDATGLGYKFIVKNPSAPYGAAQGGTIRPGEWQLVVGTYNGTTGTLYVDGVAIASDTFTAPGTVNLPIYMGLAATGGLGWKGREDEVQIWNRALTAAEVRAMYDAGSAGQCKAALGGVDALFTTSFATDGTIPAAGHGYWYVFHGDNACGEGTYGFQTDGTERVTPACD
jgi:hypothetical protein